jgi:hypothetical protein
MDYKLFRKLSMLLFLSLLSLNAITQKIDVTGDFVVDGEISILNAYKLPPYEGTSGQILTADGAGEAVWKDPLLSTLWDQSNNNIYRQNGNVGIGLNNPQAALHIFESNNVPEIRLEGSTERFIKFYEAGVEEGLVGMNAADLFILNRRLQGKIRIGTHGQSNVVIHQGKVGIGEINPESSLHISLDSAVSATLESQGNKAIKFTNDLITHGQIKVNENSFELEGLDTFQFKSNGIRKFEITGGSNLTNIDIPTENAFLYFKRFNNLFYNGFLGGNSSNLRLRGPSYGGSLSLGTNNQDIINIFPDQVDINEETNFLDEVNTYDEFWIRNSSKLNLLQEFNSNSRFGLSFWRNFGNLSVSNAGVHYDPNLRIIQIGPHTHGAGLSVSEIGNVGIGTNAPNATLHIRESNNMVPFLIKDVDQSDDWSLDIHNANHYLYLYHNGNLKGTFSNLNGNYTAVSDIRLKQDIKPIEDVLNKINLIGIYSYRFKKNSNLSKTYGYLAQEVDTIFPDAVNYDRENDVYTLDYSQMSVLGLKAVQELSQKVKDQKTKIQTLEARLEKLETLISKK